MGGCTPLTKQRIFDPLRPRAHGGSSRPTDRRGVQLVRGLLALAYLLVALLVAIEFVVRAWRFGRYSGTLVEPLFRRWFPKGPAA